MRFVQVVWEIVNRVVSLVLVVGALPDFLANANDPYNAPFAANERIDAIVSRTLWLSLRRRGLRPLILKSKVRHFREEFMTPCSN